MFNLYFTASKDCVMLRGAISYILAIAPLAAAQTVTD